MDFDTVYLRVLKFLNFRPRSEKEVRDYLNRILSHNSGNTGVLSNNELIELVIHKLKQQKFLNDTEFAKWLIRSRTEFKPKGEYLIKQELRQKGISQDIIDEALRSDIRTQSEKELAIELLERKKRQYAGMNKRERFNKAGSMLARRGFDLDTIKAAIDQVFGKMV